MEDNMFKQSIRLFSRVILWLFRLFVTPIMLIMFVLFMVITGIQIITTWTNNNEKDFAGHVREWNESWESAIEWLLI